MSFAGSTLRGQRSTQAKQLRQGNGRGKVRRDDTGKVQKTKLRHQQIVDLVEPALGKRQIAAPVQIIQNVCHGNTSGV